MGVVYEAFDDASAASSVALKTLTRVDAGGVYRLKNEFRALADVTHQNLVRLHELFAEDEQLVLHDGAGRRASASITGCAPEGVAATRRGCARRCRSCARGVAAIHAAGKLHRDLKPSNVLVTARRPRRGARLRAGGRARARRRRPDRSHDDARERHARVHGARAGRGRSPRRAGERLVRARRDAVRGAHRHGCRSTGRSGDVLAAKQHASPRRARAASSPDAPRDLDALCARAARARSRAARPTPAALAARSARANRRAEPRALARTSAPERRCWSAARPSSARCAGVRRRARGGSRWCCS